VVRDALRHATSSTTSKASWVLVDSERRDSTDSEFEALLVVILEDECMWTLASEIAISMGTLNQLRKTSQLCC
jgi:hypothetical protein